MEAAITENFSVTPERKRWMSTPRRRRKHADALNLSAGTPATVPTAAGAAPSPVDSSTHEPTHEEIARRAYQRYEQRGGDHGADWEDWFAAERDLHKASPQNRVEETTSADGADVAA